MSSKPLADAEAQLESTEPPFKRLRPYSPSSQHDYHHIALKNVIEVDGKSCSHEVAWPPGKKKGNYRFSNGMKNITIFLSFVLQCRTRRFISSPTP